MTTASAILSALAAHNVQVSVEYDRAAPEGVPVKRLKFGGYDIRLCALALRYRKAVIAELERRGRADYAEAATEESQPVQFTGRLQRSVNRLKVAR